VNTSTCKSVATDALVGRLDGFALAPWWHSFLDFLKRFSLPLVLTLLPWPNIVRAQTNTPTVKPETLAAFMEKWKTAQPMEFPTSESSRPLILAALAKDPAGPWAGYLIMQAAETSFQIRKAQGSQRKAQAASFLPALVQANALLTNALATNPTNEILRGMKEGIQAKLAEFSLEAGEDLGRVRVLAQRRLDEAKNNNDWNYGNIVYEANELLGRVAMREGKFEDARRYLRAAGQTTGSPQLNSFGPRFMLARELLEHGEQADRDAVIAFLDDVARFWAAPDKVPDLRKADALKKKQQIETWKDQIRDGKIPSSANPMDRSRWP
jgi:hypothetical protein